MSDKPTSSITRYCAYNEGMSDPPMFDESATGDWVCFWDHTSEVEALEQQIKQLGEALQDIADYPEQDTVEMRRIARAALSTERKTT